MQLKTPQNISKLTSVQKSRIQQPSPVRNLSNLKTTFNSLDPNNSGFIDKSILTQAIMYTGDNYDKQIIKMQIQKCEQNISLARFIQIFQMAEIEMNQLIANQTLFKMYDRGNKGYIEKQDLLRVSEISGVELSEQQIFQMLEFNNVPGKALFDQFAEIMNDQNLWF